MVAGWLTPFTLTADTVPPLTITGTGKANGFATDDPELGILGTDGMDHVQVGGTVYVSAIWPNPGKVYVEAGLWTTPFIVTVVTDPVKLIMTGNGYGFSNGVAPGGTEGVVVLYIPETKVV